MTISQINHFVERIDDNVFSRWTMGRQGNAWNAEATGVGGFSNVVRTYGMPYLSIMGQISADTTLSFYASVDGEHFYYCSIISTLINPTEPPAPAWSLGTKYFPGDIVTNGGNKYIALVAHTANPSNEPPDTDFWDAFAGAFPKQFHIYPVVGAEYIRLRSSNNVKATVTVCAKGGAYG